MREEERKVFSFGLVFVVAVFFLKDFTIPKWKQILTVILQRQGFFLLNIWDFQVLAVTQSVSHVVFWWLCLPGS